MAVKKTTVQLDEATLLEIRIYDTGELTINDKPAVGRRKRGSTPRVMELDLKQLWNTKTDTSTTESLFDDILKKLPIADLAGTPEKVGYKVKAWLLSQLQARKEAT